MASGGSDNWTYDFWIVHHWHLTNMHSNPNDACSVAELKSFLHLKLSSHICCRPSISCRPPICFDPSSDPEAMLNGKPVLFFLNWNLIARDLLRKPHINLSWSFGASQESAEDLYFCVIKGCSKSVGTKKAAFSHHQAAGLLSAVGALLCRLWCLPFAMLLSEDIGSDLQLRGSLHKLVTCFIWQLSATETGLIFQSIPHCIHFHFDFIWHLHVLCEHQTFGKDPN